MQTPISLKAAERKAFTLPFEDGLWDILLGLVVLEFAVAPLLTASLGDFWSSAIFLPVWALAAIGIQLLKRRLVAPRMGVVRLGLARQARLFRLNIVFLVALLLELVVGTLALMEVGASAALQTGFIAVLALIAFALAARLLQQNRFFVYGLVVSLAPVVGEWLWQARGTPHHGYPVTFGIACVFIVSAGLVKFVRFLKTYPIPTEE